jgi:hypothetical protein
MPEGRPFSTGTGSPRLYFRVCACKCADLDQLQCAAENVEVGGPVADMQIVVHYSTTADMHAPWHLAGCSPTEQRRQADKVPANTKLKSYPGTLACFRSNAIDDKVTAINFCNLMCRPSNLQWPTSYRLTFARPPSSELIGDHPSQPEDHILALLWDAEGFPYILAILTLGQVRGISISVLTMTNVAEEYA